MEHNSKLAKKTLSKNMLFILPGELPGRIPGILITHPSTPNTAHRAGQVTRNLANLSELCSCISCIFSRYHKCFLSPCTAMKAKKLESKLLCSQLLQYLSLWQFFSLIIAGKLCLPVQLCRFFQFPPKMWLFT